MEMDFSINELMAVTLARDIQDGTRAAAGANFIVPRAAVLLAHLHHGPNMQIFLPVGIFTNLFNVPVVQVYGTADGRPWKWAEYSSRHELGFQKALTDKDVFFFGAIQYDQYGNMNMFGIGDDYKHLKFRGPGIIGLAHVSTFINDFYIVATEHTKRRFVKKLDYISAVGHGDGPDYRKRWGLPGSGPKWCITPLALMDFDEKTKRMRLKSVHPGVSVEQVVENTGFELIIPKDVPVTPPPTDEELHILRTRVDPAGILRK